VDDVVPPESVLRSRWSRRVRGQGPEHRFAVGDLEDCAGHGIVRLVVAGFLDRHRSGGDLAPQTR